MYSKGPLFRPSSAETVVGQIKDAVQKGAKALTGDVADTASGDYATLVQPTVLSGISTKMDIWKRESFGPGELKCPVRLSSPYFKCQQIASLCILFQSSLLRRTTQWMKP